MGLFGLCTLTWRQQRDYSSLTPGLPKCPLFLLQVQGLHLCGGYPLFCNKPPKTKGLKAKLRRGLPAWSDPGGTSWGHSRSQIQLLAGLGFKIRERHSPLRASRPLHEVARPPQMSWNFLTALCTQGGQSSPTQAGFQEETKATSHGLRSREPRIHRLIVQSKSRGQCDSRTGNRSQLLMR